MKFNFNTHCNTLFKFILAIVFLNTTSVHAENFDLKSFKGKLTGTLFFTTDLSYTKYQFLKLNLKNGKIEILKNFKSSISQAILAEPNISLEQTHVLFTGYSIENDILKYQVLKLNLKNKNLTVFSIFNSQFILPKYSNTNKKLLVTNLYDTQYTKNIIYDLQSETKIELPCQSPHKCTMANWDTTNKNIVYLNDDNKQIKVVNVLSKKITNLYKSNKNKTIIYPTYTTNGNILFSELYKINKEIKSSQIKLINIADKTVSNILSSDEYILSAITLNDDRYIAFVTKEYINQSKLTIYDQVTKKTIIYSIPLRSISPAVWKP